MMSSACWVPLVTMTSSGDPETLREMPMWRAIAARRSQLPASVSPRRGHEPVASAALHDTGINRLLIPAALGGMEAPITDVMDVMERIAAADGSAG